MTSERDLAIAQRRRDNPCATLEQIGREFGITRERVRQILKAQGLPTKHWVSPYECLNCGQVFTPAYENLYNKKYCSKECLYIGSHVTVSCHWCGKSLNRTITELKRHYGIYKQTIPYKGHFFCDRYCYGKWLGKTYGLGTRPDHRRGAPPRKYDYVLVWKTHVKTGYGARRLGRLLNIPESTAGYILRVCRKARAGLPS